jgi:hypothetical protein
MALTKAQATIWQKVKALGTGEQAVVLTDGMCSYLLARMVFDLEQQQKFPNLPANVPALFTNQPASELALTGIDAKALFESVVAAIPDADTYFACLAALQKARLKYERILSTQPIPTLEQVGPRALLQYGKLSSRALVSLLFWRKWFFDIDNRAGQETGYLFEPVIAYAIGGTPAPSKRSPVKRHRDKTKGRQVDCIIDDRAYELKIRVTIAASGQGRWQEELDFPIDCRKSGFKPVLVCMDGTRNPKLAALEAAFRKQRGEVYIGEDAWTHLESLAGPTMSKFIERYVRGPIQTLLAQGEKPLLELRAVFEQNAVDIALGNEHLHILRSTPAATDDAEDPMPSDADDAMPGP